MISLADNSVKKYCEIFARLAPDNIDDLLKLVRDDIHFRDPFNDVIGQHSMRLILGEMFEKTQNPVFIVYEYIMNEDHSSAWLRWRFSAQVPIIGFLQTDGVSRLQIDNDTGLIAEHVDYWDSAPLYMKVPLFGRVIQLIREKMVCKEARN